MLLEELALEPERFNYKSLATQFFLRHFPLGVDEEQLDVWIEKPLEKLELVNNFSQTFTQPTPCRSGLSSTVTTLESLSLMLNITPSS